MAQVNENALNSAIRSVVINRKANACPMVVRLAWHASGTQNAKAGTGGSNGATMRFEPEASDPANAGLSIVRDMLYPIKQDHPNLSYADLWAKAGALSIEYMGGPPIKVKMGRSDAADGKACPPNGLLPDAAQGAAHIRDVFYRMGFSDKDIVALNGAHTLGRCHRVRSGYDGPWTRNPLKFDNAFFRNLLNLEWRKKDWDGPEQYEDTQTGELMMLPTDMAMKWDPEFRKYSEIYAKDQDAFFKDFQVAFGKLINFGVPDSEEKDPTEQEEINEEFREESMHGRYWMVEKLSKKADVNEPEASSGRTALHKAAFWGHEHIIELLIKSKVKPNVQDYNGDTALHDAVRFSHLKVVDMLIAAGADVKIKNKEGQDAVGVAQAYGKADLAARLAKGAPASGAPASKL